MKQVQEKEIKGLEVISEPGDATHYHYLVLRDFDDYFFIPIGNTFKYPDRVSKWIALGWDVTKEWESVEIQAEQYGCNPYTLMECFRTILSIENGEF